MNTAPQTIGINAKSIAFAIVLLLVMLFACQTCGQELEAFSQQSTVELESVLAPSELLERNDTSQDHGQSAVVDEWSADQIATSIECNSQKTPGSETLQCDHCQSQAVKTRVNCPLGKRVVCVEGRDEIWLVSARQSHLCWSDLSRIEVSLLQNEVWQPSSLETLVSAHAEDKSRATVVYCHGNRTKLAWAKSRGLQVYQSTFQNEVDQSTRPPVRFVIFAWKSEQEKTRLRPDYKLKTQRAAVVGMAFGKFLDQFSDRNMLLSGFSLGSQVVLTGLTGGESGRPNIGGRYQVALIAPALDPMFVCRSLRTLPDVSLIQRTEVVANENDVAIKAAQKLAAKTCREWLPEFKKLACTSAFATNRIQLHEIGDDICRHHTSNNYYNAEKVRCIHWEMLSQVHADQQSNVAPTSMMELEPIEVQPTQLEPISDFGQSVFTLDLPSTGSVNGVPVLAAPVEAVPGDNSN